MHIYIIYLTIIFLLMLTEKLIISTRKNGKFGNIDGVNDRCNSLGSTKKKTKVKFNFTFKLALIIIFVFTAFRYGVGWDYKAYYNTIEYGVVTNIISRGEYATIFLVDISRRIGITNLYFFVNTFITLFFLSKTIKRYSKDYWMSLIIYLCFPLFYLNSLSVVRSFAALAIVFYGFKYIEKRKFVKYLILVVCASMFHKSALISIVFYFIFNLNLKTPKLITILALLPIFSVGLSNIVIKYLPIYGVYTQNTSIQEGTKAIIIFIILAIILLIFRKKIIAANTIVNGYYNIYFVGVSIYLMFFSQGTMGHRLSLYGTIFSVLLIPEIVSKFKSRKGRFIINISIYLVCIFMFLYMISVNAETYIPYRTIFSIYK
ncbi:EpsG family protein [Clostridium sp. HBUAS56017]|uniref:EpsG family protein n=1 Tax=Clostridium sp. HBUAS56017 TaxID=2571128 RepID=UPI0011773804|nr:EpsG family protein [Clostridium sp. HBUAS56017]